MIVIFSSQDDSSTTDVLRRLHALGANNVIRINDTDFHHPSLKLTLDMEGFCLFLEEQEIKLEDISSVWYRKGSFWSNGLFSSRRIRSHPGLSKALEKKLGNESERTKEYFHYLIESKARTLGNSRMWDLNKLIVLREAKKLGIDVADFMISNQKPEFLSRIDERGRQITKAISDGIYTWDYKDSKKAYFTYTEEVDPNQLASATNHIGVSFCQDMVNKAYEVRSFYLDGRFFSAAILSQKDGKTKIDYRKYNFEKPNRNIPYAMPAALEKKLTLLFGVLGLNTGSLDLIVDHEGRHILLEINPGGQYQGVSEACNLHIGYHVANWLMQ